MGGTTTFYFTILTKLKRQIKYNTNQRLEPIASLQAHPERWTNKKMKCPKCKEQFELTWSLYFKAPFGKFNCPCCDIRLKGKHRWFYPPILIISVFAIVVPITYFISCLAGIISLVAVVPIDYLLERNFSVLTIKE